MRHQGLLVACQESGELLLATAAATAKSIARRCLATASSKAVLHKNAAAAFVIVHVNTQVKMTTHRQVKVTTPER